MTKHSTNDIKLENDINIYTESYGDAEKEPILLLHGAGNSMLNWSEDFCEELSREGFYVIRMDSRDAGRSKKFTLGNPGYELMDLVRDVIGVLDKLNIQQINVVGVSQGAAITQLLAIHYPQRVKSICLISSTPGGPGHAANDLPPVTEEIAALFNESPSEPHWDNREEVVNYLVEAERPFGGSKFDEPLARQIAEKTYDATTKVANQVTNPFMIGAGDPWRSRLSEITVPTLVIHGSEDPFFPLGHGVALSHEIPNADLLVVDGMGHANIPQKEWRTIINGIEGLIKKTT